MKTITLSLAEKSEFVRLARNAYKNDKCCTAIIYMDYSKKEALPISEYDQAMSNYRKWLVLGFSI